MKSLSTSCISLMKVLVKPHGRSLGKTSANSFTKGVVDGDEAAPPLKVAKDTKLIHLVGDCIFLLKLDELNASFMEVFNLIH